MMKETLTNPFAIIFVIAPLGWLTFGVAPLLSIVVTLLFVLWVVAIVLIRWLQFQSINSADIYEEVIESKNTQRQNNGFGRRVPNNENSSRRNGISNQFFNSNVLVFFGVFLTGIFLVSGIVYTFNTSYVPELSRYEKASFNSKKHQIRVNSGITYKKFIRLQTGMSYRQVVGILGMEGIVLSRNYLEGVQGVMPSIETIMYQWKGSGITNMNAMFQNDKLISKAQFGLN